MPNDFATATIDAATKLQEAGRDNATLLWNASIANQEKVLSLAKRYVDEAWSLGGKADTGLVDELLVNVKKGQEAAQDLATAYVAASLATVYFPVAVADQFLRQPRVS